MSTSKTEEPTPRRRREARRRGQVAQSRESISTVALFAGVGALALASPALFGGLTRVLTHAFEGDLGAALRATHALGLSVLAVLAVVALASALTSFVQVGPLWASEAVAIDPARIDPVKGAARLFKLERLVDLARHLLLLVAAGAVVAEHLLDVAPDLVRLVRASASGAASAIGRVMLGLSIRVGLVLAVFAVVDLFLQRHRHRRSLRMSLAEVRRDHRESEGDPHAKQARARAHREAATHGTLEEVRRASVLVVNPTHYAVALRFDEESEQEAPEVVAKGMDDLARRMIEAAREAGVPVVRDVPLARALHELELGEEIPETFYQAVAAILEVASKEREGG